MYGPSWNRTYESLDIQEPELQWHNFNHKEEQFNILNMNTFMHKTFFPLVHNQKYYAYVSGTPLVIINSEKKFDKLLPILEVFYFLKEISTKPVPHACKIFLIPLDIPKIIQATEFSKRNINSGVCINHEVIIIWREEEMTKVLCHEMIHMLHLDYLFEESCLMDLPRKYFNISPSMKCFPNECTTDALALYIMSFLNSKRREETPEDVFRKEVIWTIQQCKKIWNNLDNPDNIYTEADIISYYFLKSLLLCSMLYDQSTCSLLLSDTILCDVSVPKNVNMLRSKILSQKTLDLLKSLADKIEFQHTPTLKMSKFSI